MLAHPHDDGIGRLEGDRQRLQVLAGAPQETAVGHGGPGVVVVAGQLADELGHEVVVRRHDVTSTSQDASWLGVRAAISMPRSASRWAIARS